MMLVEMRFWFVRNPTNTVPIHPLDGGNGKTKIGCDWNRLNEKFGFNSVRVTRKVEQN